MSLLARFFNQIKSSQEDIASEGLRYILQNSDLAKSIINGQIKSKTNLQLQELNYVSQISKTGLGRTDISGIDINGNEIVIFEAKFWASLTENQPASYLKRLPDNSVLAFICPSLRKSSLDKNISSSILKILNYFCKLLTKFINLLGSIKNFKFIRVLDMCQELPRFYGLAYYEYDRHQAVTCPIFFNYILRYGNKLYLFLINPKHLEQWIKKGY